MGLFSRDNRVTYKLSGKWERLWDSDSACAPSMAMKPVQAFHRLGDLANLSGATSGDALVIAVEVVSAIDRHGDYPAAMDDLKRFYERGDLRTVRDEPLDRLMTWPAVVEVAEAASRMARTYKVDGWRNEVLASVGNGDETDVTPLFELAPHATMEAYNHWKAVLRECEAMTPEERDADEDNADKLEWLRRVVGALHPFTAV